MFFFFFNDTATTEIYTLSLHDALPIWIERQREVREREGRLTPELTAQLDARSEEHTSELQSRLHLVCRLLLEKKKRSYRIEQILDVHPLLAYLDCAHVCNSVLPDQDLA